MNFRKLGVWVAASVLGTVFASVTVVPAMAVGTCGLTGDGTASSPWTISSSSQLTCLETANLTPASGSVKNFELTADVTKTSSAALLAGSPVENVSLKGNGHTITVENQANFHGLFPEAKHTVLKNFTVAANNSTIDPNHGGARPYGWVIGIDIESTIENVHSTGDIAEGAGGLVGTAQGTRVTGSSSSGVIGQLGGGILAAAIPESGAIPATRAVEVTRSHSSGTIGSSGGGIIGFVSGTALVSYSYSTGEIDNGGAGGIVGNTMGDVTVTGSYSTGSIGMLSGGILGQYSQDFRVVNSFSTGLISVYAGGIVGPYSANGSVTNSYVTGTVSTDGGGIFGRLSDPGTPATLIAAHVYVAGDITGSPVVSQRPESSGSFTDSNVTVTIVNSFAAQPGDPAGWSDVTAARVLTGYQGWGAPYVWVQCQVNTPASIAALLASDPCPGQHPRPQPGPNVLPNTGVSSPASLVAAAGVLLAVLGTTFVLLSRCRRTS